MQGRTKVYDEAYLRYVGVLLVRRGSKPAENEADRKNNHL